MASSAVACASALRASVALTRRSYVRAAPDEGMSSPDLQPVSLQPPIERAAAQAEGLGGLADVAIEPRHRLLDEEPFDFLEAHILDARRRVAIDPQPELAEADRRAERHQDAAFDRVVELADVAGPRMVEERLHRRGFEAVDVLAVP